MDIESESGITLGNAIIAARSASAFFADEQVRIQWTREFLRDLLNFVKINNKDSSQYQILNSHFPNWDNALFRFCLGKLTPGLFSNIAVDPVNSLIKSNERLLTQDRGGEEPVGRDQIYTIERWKHAVNHVAKYTNSTYSDTDLKIEFERVYELDASPADGGYSFYDKTLTMSESMKVVLSFSFLNKAAVFASGALESDRVHYKSYMFGSNLLLLDNDLADSEIPGTWKFRTLHRHVQRILDMTDTEMERFIYNIVTVTGGYVVDCPRYGGSSKTDKRKPFETRGELLYGSKKRRIDRNQEGAEQCARPPAGCVQFTSFNRMNNSIQFTFNTHNRRYYYTANVLTLPVDDFCTNDLVYRRRYVTGVCGCLRSTLAWRICVLVTPINTATIADGDARIEVDRVVMAALKSFRSVYENKSPDRRKGGRSRVTVMSGFLGMPIAPYLDKTSSPKEWRSKTDPNDTTYQVLCGFHSWLRAYSGSEWTLYRGKNALLRLLDENGGRAVIVKRPVFMSGADGTSVGWRTFVRYMTYEDTVEKVLRLTERTFHKGFDPVSYQGHPRKCGVAYVRGPQELIVFKTPYAGSLYPNDDAKLAVEEQKRLSPESIWWWVGFHAPSQVIVDIEVLFELGFNPVTLAVAYTGGGRTFEHEDPDTGNSCTVFCSTLIRIVTRVKKRSLDDYEEEDKYGHMVGEPDVMEMGVIDQEGSVDFKGLVSNGIRVLYDETPMSSRLDSNRPEVTPEDERGYRRRIHDVTAYWPGTYMVTIDFVDPDLKHVMFAFFTGTGGEQMTLENLLDFSDHCTSNNLLPPPILNTIQSVVLKDRYTD